MALLEMNIYSHELGINTSVTVIYPNSKKKLKLIYLLHGYIGNNKDWQRYSNIETYANLLEYIVIMPDGGNSFYTNIYNGPNYFNYISKELPNIIKEILNINVSRDKTFIAGLSMGGYGALKIALSNPSNFKAAASLSGVTNINKAYLNQKDAKVFDYVFNSYSKFREEKEIHDLYELLKNDNTKNLDYYISCGTLDFLYNMNLEFKDYLIKNKYKISYNESNHGHTWDFWDKEVLLALKYFDNLS